MIAVLASCAAGAGLMAAQPAHADPTVLYPLASGSVDAYSYDVQVGPGTGLGGGPAFCTSVAIRHVTDVDSDPPLVSCDDTYDDELVGDGRVLRLEGHVRSLGLEDPFTVNMYGVTPKAQRIKVKVAGRKALILTRASSKVLTIAGERVRFFHVARVQADPRLADSVVGQARKCRTVVVKGKKRRKCSWRTVADQMYFLV
ncbi:hypothetical protein [Nocardioides solisilvae]|uniref:hypothetical protein n=1 Tax=Nocardioides solisilvae TaxID=1542435 RepID=UPI0013A5335A|nr:hypothetical protein [Nocardioides solisilvae]